MDQANKDLIKARDESHQEIKRLSAESISFQTKYRQQTERLHRAEQLNQTLRAEIEEVKGAQYRSNVNKESDAFKMMEANLEDLRNALKRSQNQFTLQSEKLATLEKVTYFVIPAQTHARTV